MQIYIKHTACDPVLMLQIQGPAGSCQSSLKDLPSLCFMLNTKQMLTYLWMQCCLRSELILSHTYSITMETKRLY